MRYLLLAMLLALPVRADDAWNSAVETLTAGEAPRARLLFEQWLAEKGSDSPEAHYNLALACWAAKDAGCASFHLLRSAQLRTSPFVAWQLAEKVTSLEREVGMKDGISDDLLFRAFLILNRRWQLWLGAIGFWLVVAGTQVLFQRKHALRLPPALAIYAVALFLFTTAATAWANQRYFSHYAVLAGAKPVGVPLLRTPAAAEDNKLADLPNGVVVTIAETQDGATRITSPVSGWVASDTLKML